MFNRKLISGAALLAWCLAVTAGCGQTEAEPGISVHGFPMPHRGQTSLEERIVNSDVVARVRMASVAAGTADGQRSATVKVATLRYTFDVLEYLKGSGGNQVVAVVLDGRYYFRMDADAMLRAQELLAARDTRWDDREAIVFLETAGSEYRLGYADVYRDESRYTVSSRWSKNWLPEASAPSGGASGQSGEKRFLLDDPGSVALGASGASTPTMTLTEFKTKITGLQSELDAGDGSAEYLECVRVKYATDRLDRWYYVNMPEGLEPLRVKGSIGSGQPAESVFFSSTYSVSSTMAYELSGADGDLFTAATTTVPGHPNWAYYHAMTARPLPAGRYTFHFNSTPRLCEPTDFVKTTPQDYVTVTALAGTLHEAFFDPVAIGTAVGADSSNGVLKPNAFSLDGTNTTISSLKWEDGAVTMILSPSASLAGYAVDFIALDGSVTTTLAFDDATQSGGTLTWSVPDKPWNAGDLLMLRIAARPSITISGLDASIEAGQSDAFTVSASNMATTTSYSIRVTTDDSDIGFDGACADRQQDTTVTEASTSASAAFTLHACGTPGGTVTATLLQGTTAVATTTRDVTVTAPPPPPQHAPAPAGLSVDSSTETSLSVSWNTVQDSYRYKLERSPSGTSGWSRVVIIGGTSHTLSGLSCATTVHFRVSARGDGSPYSTTFGAPSTASVSGTTSDCTTTPVSTTTTPSPPVFAPKPYSFTVSENASAFHSVGTVSAVDPDGGIVTYSIVAGNGDGKFKITRNDGLIVVWGALDYDATSSYALTVRATDSSGATSTVTVNISITDVP